jgi:glutamate 5-kinase
MKNKFLKNRLWIVKAGSQMICSGGPLLIRSWMQQVHELKEVYGIQVIWVTSGAIASAKDRIHFNKKNRTLPEKQALSAIGQPLVMDIYNLALGSVGRLGAQVLLTAGDIKNKSGKQNLQNTLSTLLRWKAVPIINENDAVATDEIQFGDNDKLSSEIAKMMGAEKLIILTDVDGLYDANPRTHKKAKLIPHIDQVNSKWLNLTQKNNVGSSRGTGGMYSKLLAAKNSVKNNITCHLIRGDIPRNLISIAQGKPIGTVIGTAVGVVKNK